MKKLIFSLFCVFAGLVACGQGSSDFSYSADLRVFSWMQLPKILNQTNSQDYNASNFSSAFIKFNDNQLSFRIGAYYLNNDLSFSNQCTTCQQGNGKLVDYFFKIGVEKNFNYSIIQPYVGIDLGYRSNTFTGIITDVQPSSATPDYSVEASKNGILLSPLIGLKINFLKQLTFFAESNIDFFYSYERRETTDLVAGSPTFFNKFTRLEYLLNPVSLGLQLHFGRKDQ